MQFLKVSEVLSSCILLESSMTNHLSEYLDYYGQLKNPGYAVLVTGEWGVGKTHQVCRCINETDCFRVSLFGLRTPNEVHTAIYAAYAPTLSKLGKVLGAAGETAENVGGLFSLGGAAADWLNAIMRQNIEPNRTLIFDDLERCSMSLEEMMGVFSTYIDHLGFRVVLVADEERLKERHKAYPQVKEKVIGHTAKVVPQASEAFDAFIWEVESASREYLQEAKTTVLEVFQTSGCMSLRILRHVIFDLTRLYQSLRPNHIDNSEAMSEIISLFVACEIEVRLGRISAGDLINRAGRRYAYEIMRHASKDKEVDQPPLVAADERYSTINLESQILDDQVLADVLENGVFDKEKIVASVSRSSHFVEPGDVPAWKLVASFDELPDEVFQMALEKMETQFANREITSSGEMLHIFALRLMMAEEGILESDLESTRDECLSYIDDLFSSSRLPPRELSWSWWDSLDQGYDGYTYWVRSGYQSHFKAIRDRLIARREAALEATFPTIMSRLLAMISDNGTEFYHQVCQTVGRDSPYALIPILKCVEPAVFVDAWLAAPRPAWRWVKRALECRLEPHRVQNELMSERSWALNVLREMEKRRDLLTGFERLRIQRVIPYKLRQLEESLAFEAEPRPELSGDY